MKKSKSRIKLTTGELIFSIFNYIFLTLFVLICTYPFYFVFINCIGSQREIAQGIIFWPKVLDFSTYKELLTSPSIPSAFFISVSRSLVSTTMCVLFTSLFAYLVTQKDMFARKFVYRFTIITMYVSGGLIPWFLTMKAYHLQDTFLLYVLPGIINAFYLILVKTYIESIPSSLEEAAAIDG